MASEGRIPVDRDCKQMIEALVEVAGDLDKLDASVRDHVETCASCRESAAAERSLDRVLSAAVPPGDPELEGRVSAMLAPARRRRRRAAFLPVAASSLVALAGGVVLGGVPGAGLIGQLPRLSSQLWLGLAGAASDWGVGVTTATAAASTTMPPGLQAASLLVSIAGLVAVVAAARRWRPLASWQRDS